jgi:hypothetical protein
MNKTQEKDPYLYDAVLTRIDAAAGVLTFAAVDVEHTVTYPHVVSWWTVGAVGRLRLSSDPNGFAFHTYVDQRLRRAPDLDDPKSHRWGWRIEERGFRVRAGLLPGQDGGVVRLDTTRLVLPLPREFIEYCTERGLKPASVLRAFVADLCGIMNWCVCPREDGYSSNGSDERLYAETYFQRCFGWVDDPEYRKTLKVSRKGRKHAQSP